MNNEIKDWYLLFMEIKETKKQIDYPMFRNDVLQNLDEAIENELKQSEGEVK